MSDPNTQPSGRPPWYIWLLVPIELPVGLLVMLPLGLMALVSNPYYALFPDHHAHLYDFEGSPRQRKLLSRWRAGYSRLGFHGRVARAIKLRRRGRPV